MANINEFLNEILTEIQISDEEIDKAIEKHKDIREKITDTFAARTLITGSYKRKTGVKPLNDVDVLMWLPKDLANINNLDDLDQVSPEQLLKKLKRKLRNLEIDHDSIYVQNHSLGIRYSNDDFSIDLIPAFSESDPIRDSNFNRDFLIPEKESGKWIKTNPEKHREILTKANKIGNNKVVPLIKILKSWRNNQSRNRKTFKSFHLESLCIYLAFTNKEIFEKGKGMFEVLVNSINKIRAILEQQINIAPTLDLPENPFKYLEEDENRYQRSVRKLNAFNKKLNDISKLTDSGDHETAGEKLRFLIIGENQSGRYTSNRHTKMSNEAGNVRFGQ